jgi:hypothetical protein
MSTTYEQFEALRKAWDDLKVEISRALMRLLVKLLGKAGEL